MFVQSSRGSELRRPRYLRYLRYLECEGGRRELREVVRAMVTFPGCRQAKELLGNYNHRRHETVIRLVKHLEHFNELSFTRNS